MVGGAVTGGRRWSKPSLLAGRRALPDDAPIFSEIADVVAKCGVHIAVGCYYTNPLSSQVVDVGISKQGCCITPG